MKALIIGNSQAEGAGKVLETILKNKKYEVKRLAKHGAVTKDIITLYDTVKHPDYNLVVVFDWDYNNIDKLLAKFTGNPEIVWFGSPPSTKILDLSLAKKVFGSKIKNENSWTELGYDKDREFYNVKLKELLPKNVKYIDYRNLNLPNSVAQKIGVSFPNLQDGIHITNTVAKEMFSEQNWPNATIKETQTNIIPYVAGGFGMLIAILFVIRFRQNN